MRTDEELMLATARGDLGAFGQLVERHQASAWNAAYRFLGNAVDAEDIAQEAFLRVLDAAPRYRATAKFRTFLFRIVTRLCIDVTRRKTNPGSGVEPVMDQRAGRSSRQSAANSRRRSARR
jgi:RNA polymerase sigma-70 factor (ECF subfamily)